MLLNYYDGNCAHLGQISQQYRSLLSWLYPFGIALSIIIIIIIMKVIPTTRCLRAYIREKHSGVSPVDKKWWQHVDYEYNIVLNAWVHVWAECQYTCMTAFSMNGFVKVNEIHLDHWEELYISSLATRMAGQVMHENHYACLVNCV